MFHRDDMGGVRGMRKTAGTIAGLIIILGLTSTSYPQEPSCAAKLGSKPKVAEIIQCLQTQEAELHRLNQVSAQSEELAQQVTRLEQDLEQHLAGAIVAFDLPTGCPDGWQEFVDAASRMIIGVGSRQIYRTQGGEEEHSLTVAELPNHSHKLEDSHVGVPLDPKIPKDIGSADAEFYKVQVLEKLTYSKGGSVPHNNMPPYITLHFCKKE